MVWFRVQGKGQRSSGKVNECPQYHASMRMNGYRVLVLIRLMLMPSAGVQADALWLMQTDAMVSLYILRSKPTRFFFASLAFEVISFNACISAMEKTVRWTQALVLLRHLPGALRTNSSCSQLQGFRDASHQDSATPFHNLVDEAPFQHRR